MLTMYGSRRNTSQPDALGDGPVVGARRRVARDRFLWIFHRVARRELQKSGRRDRPVVISINAEGGVTPRFVPDGVA